MVRAAPDRPAPGARKPRALRRRCPEEVARPDQTGFGTPCASGGWRMWVSKVFGDAAAWVARAAGRPVTFALCVLVVVAWAATGPLFGFSDTWQLVINTGTTIVTFLMVFLIQNTQNRDTEALQL